MKQLRAVNYKNSFLTFKLLMDGAPVFSAHCELSLRHSISALKLSYATILICDHTIANVCFTIFTSRIVICARGSFEHSRN